MATFPVSGFANLYQRTDPETVVPGSTDAIPLPDARLCPGQELQVSATGCVVDAGPTCTGPDGSETLFRGLRVYSLIGRWSSSPTVLDNTTVASAPFFVGSSASLTAPAAEGSYYLFLGENDGVFGDNGGAYAVTATWDHRVDCRPDSDDDGIPDDVDACPGTVIPEWVPTTGALGVNHWALVDDDAVFDTQAPNGQGPARTYTLSDTAGCSCAQIIEASGLGEGLEKHGCSIGVMDTWVSDIAH